MKQGSLKRYLITGGAWAFSGKILSALMGLMLSALLTRLLPPSEVGAYFLAFNLATFLAIFARFGMENTALRMVAESMAQDDPGRAREVVGRTLMLTLIGSLAVGVLFGGLLGPWLAQSVFSSPGLASVCVLVGVWIGLLAFQVLVMETFRGFQDIRGATVFGGLLSWGSAVLLAGVLWAAVGQSHLQVLLALVILGGTLNLLVAGWALGRRMRSLSPLARQSLSSWELLVQSWPLLINGVTFFIMSQSSLWILGAFRPEAEVAVYGAAARLVLLTGMALTIVNGIVPPLIARMNTHGQRQDLERLLRSTATLAAMPSLAVLSAFVIFGSPILGVIFGEYYRGGYLLLSMLSVGQVVSVLVGSCGFALVMMGHQKTMMHISILAAAVSVTAAILLVRPLGKEGAALAVTITSTFQQVLMWLYAKKNCGIWTHASLKNFRNEIKIFRKSQEEFS